MDSCSNNKKVTKIIVNHAIFLEFTTVNFLIEIYQYKLWKNLQRNTLLK